MSNTTAPTLHDKARVWIPALCRFGLAAVWIISGFAKIGDGFAMRQSVAAYDLFNADIVAFIALVLPPVEIALGVMLLIGLLLRIAGALSALMLVAFIAGIVSAWARGLTIDCGCFGKGGADPSVTGWKYATEIIRDTLFLLMAAIVTARPFKRFSLPGLV